MKAPYLSVVLPAHNEAEQLYKQISAILRQSQPYGQFVLMDDGSTDSTRELIDDIIKASRLALGQHPSEQSFSDNAAWASDYMGINLISRQTPLGCCGAFNYAAEAATGDWLYLASANDVLQPNAFAAWYQAAKRFPTAQLICGSPLSHDLAWLPAMGFLSPTQVRHALKSQHIHGCATFIRREAWDKYGGFRNDLGSLADFWLYHLIALRHGVVYLTQPIAKVGNKPSCHDDVRSADKRRAIVGRIEELLALPENSDIRDGFEHTILRRIMKR